MRSCFIVVEGRVLVLSVSREEVSAWPEADASTCLVCSGGAVSAGCAKTRRGSEVRGRMFVKLQGRGDSRVICGDICKG